MGYMLRELRRERLKRIRDDNIKMDIRENVQILVSKYEPNTRSSVKYLYS